MKNLFIIFAVLLLSCAEPVAENKIETKVEQDIAYLDVTNDYCLTTWVWYEGTILSHYTVYTDRGKITWNNGNLNMWVVKELNDSVKSAQFNLGVRTLKHHEEVLKLLSQE